MRELSALDTALTGAQFLTDPYPTLQALREHEPVHWCEPWGMWVLTKYSHVLQVLKEDGRRFSTTRSVGGRLGKAIDSLPVETRGGYQAIVDHYRVGLIASDPPDHTRLRTTIARTFTPKAVEALRPAIAEMASALIDHLPCTGPFDVVSDFAYPLPAMVLHRVLGLPQDDLDQVKAWAGDITGLIGTNAPTVELADRAQDALLEARDYIATIAKLRQRNPTNDVISQLVIADDRLTDAELLNTCTTFLVGGHETTTALISSGLMLLLQNPHQQSLLRSKPELMGQTAEEILRFESPVQRVVRFVKQEVEVDGRPMSRDEALLLSLAAANRDPEQFAQPDTFDITRDPNPQIGFASGIHACLGAPLAKLEGVIALAMLLERFPVLASLRNEYNWVPNHAARRLVSLPVIAG